MKKISLIFALLVVALIPAGHVNAGVNDFVITDYTIDYRLGRNDDNRSVLTTTETIQAVFPQSNQNHGIERAIPTSYDGHSVKLNIESVTNISGDKLPYTTYSSNGNEVLRIGDSDKYVHGQQTYVIKYVQQDVTKSFKDSNNDEFYWDTNGTEWKVPTGNLSVNLRLDGDLADELNGEASCYRGKQGDDSRCELVFSQEEFSVNATHLSAGENITIAVGFKEGTFAAYQPTIWDKLYAAWILLLFATFFAALILVIWFMVRYAKKSNRTNERATIVPEYLPPKNSSVTVSASIYNRPTTAFSAQLIDLAVRHYIKIYQISDKSLFKQAKYELEIVKDIASLSAEEQEILEDIFTDTSVGSRLNMDDMKKRARSIALDLSDNKKKLDADIRGKYGLRAKDELQRRWFKRAGLVTLAFAAITLSPWLLVAAITAFICAYTLWPLTDKGLSLYRYLEGLKMYIRVAEQERLRILQSPSGAQKSSAPIDTNDKRQMIKLYERVLPYAVLFKQEKKWNKELGKYYESLNTSPDWYVGNNAVFNAAILSSAISNFSTAATYSNPTSSSSGGSGGGGFSGGGGGGGGGGGW